VSAVPPTERVEGFGLYNFSVSPVFRPASLEELRAVLTRCVKEGARPVFRGAGRSYGDAATNPAGPMVEMTRMNTVTAFDEETGILRAGAGLTVGELWRFSIARGFWPPVVTGTMHVTLGGAVAMNVHGKNGWKKGTIGDHVESISLLRDGGRVEELVRGTPGFDAVVGNWRLSDPIVEVALRLRKVATGYLDVEAFTTPGLSATLAALDRVKDEADYLVAWMDCWATGKALGRSVVHVAKEHGATDGEPRGLSVEEQIKDVRVGPLPLPVLLFGLKLTAAGPQMRFVNFAKYAASAVRGRHRYRQSLVAYSFLFDYLPGWNEVYRPRGFIQYQLFVPKEAAEAALGKALRLQREHGVVSSLAVAKRHRADRFPGGYVRDGFSLALDFPVTRRNASRLISLCRAFDALLLECGGRAYKAKDCVGSVERLARSRSAT
jgi:decaprenylphospho-beta-D-ribofuranose 2-oxidase